MTARISRSAWSAGTRASQLTQPNNPVCSSTPRSNPIRNLQKASH